MRWSSNEVDLAVLGFPIGHSISPPMHNAALRKMAESNPRFKNWRYHRFEVHPDQLGEVLPLLHQKRFKGVNLTIPHKIIAVHLISKIDPAAAETGAVNTLLWTPDGYHGFNTDGYGLEKAIEIDLGARIEGADVALLGAGGAARAAAVLCVRRRCRRLFLGNRAPAKLEPLRKDLTALGGDTTIEIFDPATPDIKWPENILLINATSAGLAISDAPPVDIRRFPQSTRVYDMIYNPPDPVLARRAREAGMRAANGLSMLIYQGVRALEIWSETEVPADEMTRAAKQALA